MATGGKVLTAVAAFALLAAPASAADLRIAETFDAAGDPGLTAYLWSPDGAELEWRRCDGGSPVCVPIPATVSSGPYATSLVAFPGETPAGTVFEATATKDGVATTARTRAWQGRVRSIAAPTLQGEPAAGGMVTVTQGTWAGGWGPVPELKTTDDIYACRTPAGTDCWLIEYGPAAVLDPRWAGWYLFAGEWHSAGSAYCHSAFGCSALVARAAPPVRVELQAGATSARSAPLGPVTAPAPEPPVMVAREAKAPSASIRSRALRREGRLRVGRVSCETRCTVRLTVSGGNRRTVDRTFRVTGVKALTVPVRHGKLKVRVRIDGKLVASATTRAR